MIYSRKHRFLFIKGTKVGSTSVEMALSRVCAEDDIVTPITPVDELARMRAGGRGAQNYSGDRHAEQAYLAKLPSMTPDELATVDPPMGTFVNHMSLRDVDAVVGGIPPGTLAFGVERSPYEKVMSFANMLLRFNDYRSKGNAMISNIDELKAAIARVVESGQAPLVRNIDRYRDPSGALTMRILRYDDLENAFARLLVDLGLPPMPLPRAKQGMGSERFNPRELFEPEHLARVNEEFADEFAALGWPRVEPVR